MIRRHKHRDKYSEPGVSRQNVITFHVKFWKIACTLISSSSVNMERNRLDAPVATSLIFYASCYKLSYLLNTRYLVQIDFYIGNKT